MKTPLQELLKLESDLTRMFDSDKRVAMALLEHIRNNKKAMLDKDEEVIKDAYSDGVDNARALYECTDYYNETFNTKER